MHRNSRPLEFGRKGWRSHRTSPGERQRWIERFEASGLSQAAFAKTHGLVLSTLSRWLRQAGAGMKPRFQEIRLGSPGFVSNSAWEAEVQTPAGVQIRLSGALAKSTVSSLLGMALPV